ncbi:MAG: hypothetical protein ACTHJJ_07155 [Intrasporangium sp.]|uniref:hypothetical protein n=1 Tax=Intrasporangium sp. TaxID=1925024 RepID=UPI003F80A69F
MLADAAPPGFYAPDPYQERWLWVGVALVGLVMLWYGFVWWATRERPLRQVPGPGTTIEALRRDYLRQIDAVLRRARSGDVSDRQAHQQLSVLVRHFVQEMSGIAAPTMTLTDLTESGDRLVTVAETVATLYPGEFGTHRAETLEGSAALARQVVTGWS